MDYVSYKKQFCFLNEKNALFEIKKNKEHNYNNLKELDFDEESKKCKDFYPENELSNIEKASSEKITSETIGKYFETKESINFEQHKSKNNIFYYENMSHMFDGCTSLILPLT